MSCSKPIIFPDHKLDKISLLPDDILLKCMSLLDLHIAVRTSALAKRWRYLWTWLPDLDLHPRKMPSSIFDAFFSNKIGPQQYLTLVQHILEAHRSPRIRKFTLGFLSKWNTDIKFENFARFAFSKRVEDLELVYVAPHGSALFPLGFDILKPSPIDATFNLKSLRTSSLDITGEALEYILAQSPLLEQLCVINSPSLRALYIFSNKLKHLTISRCSNLKELQIDALNLTSFHFIETAGWSVRTHIVFKRVPKLVQVCFETHDFFDPIHSLEQISCISTHLTKLSFDQDVFHVPELPPNYFDSLKKRLLFLNVKHIDVTVGNLNSTASLFTKFLVDVCPKLHLLQLRVLLGTELLLNEAKVLREIVLEDEKNDEVAKVLNFYDYLEQLEDYYNWDCHQNPKYKNRCHSNLKEFEILGFHGCDHDVEFAMDIIACADSLLAFICGRNFKGIGQISDSDLWYADNKKELMRRARKFAKLVSPRILVGVRDESSLSWVS